MDINEIITRSEKNEFLKFKNHNGNDITEDQTIMNHLEAWVIFQLNLTLIRLDISEIERIDIGRDIETVYHDKYLFLLCPKLITFSIVKNSTIILYFINGWYIDGSVVGKVIILKN